MNRLSAVTFTFVPVAVLLAAVAPTHSTVRLVIGRATDASTMKALAQVQVLIPGTNIGSITKTNGTFVLQAVPTGADHVKFRHPCYFPVRVTIPTDGDATIAIGVPFDAASLRRPGCGGLGARTPDTLGTP